MVGIVASLRTRSATYAPTTPQLVTRCIGNGDVKTTIHPGVWHAAPTGASTADSTSMGFTLTPVHVLEVLFWTDVEERR